MWKQGIVLTLLLGVCSKSFAGTDIVRVISQMWLDASGSLWFRLNNSSADPYCAAGWGNNNLYVPASDPNFAFYYGIVLASVSKAQNVYVPNISVFNGTTSCDITKTSYGLMLKP